MMRPGLRVTSLDISRLDSVGQKLATRALSLPDALVSACCLTCSHPQGICIHPEKDPHTHAQEGRSGASCGLPVLAAAGGLRAPLAYFSGGCACPTWCISVVPTLSALALPIVAGAGTPEPGRTAPSRRAATPAPAARDVRTLLRLFLCSSAMPPKVLWFCPDIARRGDQHQKETQQITMCIPPKTGESACLQDASTIRAKSA